MAEQYKFDPRVRLAMDLGDDPFESGATTQAVYRGVLAAMEPRFVSTLNVIRRLRPHETVLTDSCSDNVASLFQLMGSSAGTLDGPAIDLSRARLAAFGCFSHTSPLSREALGEFFERGGVLVTSDKAIARLQYNFPGLHIDRPARPQRGRIVVSPRSTRGWDGLATAASSLATAVTLEAGHIPVDTIPASATPVSVLAHDALGGRPLAAVAPVGRGWLVHSVAHWYQRPPGLPTDVERRPIDTLARHLKGLDVPPDASVGLFMAARAMLFTLLSGLEIAFRDEGFDSAPGRS